VKTGAHLQETCNAATELRPSFGRLSNATEDFEESTLAGAIAPNKADDLALVDLEVQSL